MQMVLSLWWLVRLKSLQGRMAWTWKRLSIIWFTVRNAVDVCESVHFLMLIDFSEVLGGVPSVNAFKWLKRVEQLAEQRQNEVSRFKKKLKYGKPRNKRRILPERQMEIMDQYLAKLRYRVNETEFDFFTIPAEHTSTRWGSFSPAWRFTRDQVPLPFDMSGGRAWSFDTKSSQTIGAGPGLEKRQATLDLCFSGDLSEELLF